MTRFEFTPPAPPLALLFALVGMGGRWRRIELDRDVLIVRLGWGFRARIPREQITDARGGSHRVWSWGAHGFAGDWLVNTSGVGVVVLEISPVARAWVIGVPIRLRRLRISVADPDGFLAALWNPPR